MSCRKNQPLSEKELEELINMSDEDEFHEFSDYDDDSVVDPNFELDYDVSDNSSVVLENEDELEDLQTKFSEISQHLANSEDQQLEEVVSTNANESLPSYSKSNDWTNPKGLQVILAPFSIEHGVDCDVAGMLAVAKPGEFFSAVVTDSIFELIVEQTNIYATQMLTDTDAGPSSRLHEWNPTDIGEIKKFFGLITWMGIMKLPAIADYWSQDPLFKNSFASSVMSRNRFEILLKMVHFAKRLHKVSNLVNLLLKNYQSVYTPNKNVCVDESMIPFRGRLLMRQYNKQKRHKYGIKVFKLYCGSGYTYNLQIYAGKTLEKTKTTPTGVVMELCEPILDQNRTVCTDNWYTSVDLGNKLLNRNTYLIGTIRRNRKEIPKDIVEKKIKVGEIAAAENSRGITFLNWKDKRNVFMLSTLHSIQTEIVKTKRGTSVTKPLMVVDYNKVKAGVDLLDVMKAYSCPLRKTVKWYRKLAIELLLNTSMVNAYILFAEVTNEKMGVVEFRKEIVKYLCQKEHAENVTTPLSLKRKCHEFTIMPGRCHKIRKYCKMCYEDISRKEGRQTAKNRTKKVNTICKDCDGQPSLCLDCFNRMHK